MAIAPNLHLCLTCLLHIEGTLASSLYNHQEAHCGTTLTLETPTPVCLSQGRLYTRATEPIAGQRPSHKPQVLHLEHSQACFSQAGCCILATSTTNQKSQQQELNAQAPILHIVPDDDSHHVAAMMISLIQCLLMQ